jgi:hypothetical protein
MTDFFDRLEDQLRASIVRERAPNASPERQWSVTRRTTVIAAGVATLLAVPASAAMLGVFAPEREPDGLVRTAPRGLIAKGVDPQFGQWEAFVSESTVGDCLGLRLIDPPGIEPGSTSEGCGVTDEPARLGGGDGPARTALFGFASPEASQVRILADNHPGRVLPTHRSAESRRPFFFASLPVAPNELRNPRVVELDPDGNPIE